jgi:hypothetical protein
MLILDRRIRTIPQELLSQEGVFVMFAKLRGQSVSQDAPPSLASRPAETLVKPDDP